jgi:hypothetical protein
MRDRSTIAHSRQISSPRIPAEDRDEEHGQATALAAEVEAVEPQPVKEDAREAGGRHAEMAALPSMSTAGSPTRIGATNGWSWLRR